MRKMPANYGFRKSECSVCFISGIRQNLHVEYEIAWAVYLMAIYQLSAYHLFTDHHNYGFVCASIAHCTRSQMRGSLSTYINECN